MASGHNGSSRNLFDTLFTLVKVEKDENNFKPMTIATPKCSLADSLQVVSVSSCIKPDLDSISYKISSTQTDSQSNPPSATVNIVSMSEICTNLSCNRDVGEVPSNSLFTSSSFVLTSSTSNSVLQNQSYQPFSPCSASLSDNKNSISPKTQTIRLSSVNCSSNSMLSSNPSNLSSLYSAPVILPSSSNNITLVPSISTSSDLHCVASRGPQAALYCLSSSQQKLGTIVSHALTPSSLSLDCIDGLEQDPNKLAYIQHKCMKLRYPVQLAVAMSKLCSGSNSMISVYSNKSIERSKTQSQNRRVVDHGFLEIDASHFTLNSATFHPSEKQASKNNNLDRPRTKAQLRRLNSENRLIAGVDDKPKDVPLFSNLGHSKSKQASSIENLQVFPTCSDISARTLNASLPVPATEPNTTEDMTRVDASTANQCSHDSSSLNKNNNHSRLHHQHLCHKYRLRKHRLKSNLTSVRIKKSYDKHWKSYSIKSTRSEFLNNNNDNQDNVDNLSVLSKSDSTNLRLLTSVEFVDSSVAKFSKSPYWIEVCPSGSDSYTPNINLLLGDVIRIVCLLLRNRSFLTLINNIVKHCWKFCREISISNLRIKNSSKLSALKPQTENANRLGYVTNLFVIEWPSNNAFKNAFAYACQNLPTEATWLNCCSKSLLCSVSCFILKPEARRKIMDLSLIVSHFDREVSSIHPIDKIAVRKRRVLQANDHVRTPEMVEKDPVFYQKFISYLPKSFVMLTRLQVNMTTRHIAGLGLLIHCFQNIINSFVMDHSNQVPNMSHLDNVCSLISQLHVSIANCLQSLRDSYASLISAGACLRARYEIKNSLLNAEQNNTNLRIARGRARLFPSDEAARLNICRILRVEIASRLSGFLSFLDKVYTFLNKFIGSPMLLGPFNDSDAFANTTSLSFKAWIDESLISAKASKPRIFSCFDVQYSEYMCRFHQISNYLKSVLSKYLYTLNSNISLMKLQLSETYTSITTSWLPTFAERPECVDQRADRDLQCLTSSLQQQYDSTEVWLRCEHNYKLQLHRNKLLELFTNFFKSDKDHISNIVIPLPVNQLSIPYGSKNSTSVTCRQLNLSPLPSWTLISERPNSAISTSQKILSSTAATVVNDTVPNRTLLTRWNSNIPEFRSSANQINVITESDHSLIDNLSDIVRLDVVNNSLPICQREELSTLPQCSNIRVGSASHSASLSFTINTSTGISPNLSSLVYSDTISTPNLQKTYCKCTSATDITNDTESLCIPSVHNCCTSTQKSSSKCVLVSVDPEANENDILALSRNIKTEDTYALNKNQFSDVHTSYTKKQDIILQTCHPSYSSHENQEEQQSVNLLPNTETELDLSKCSKTINSDLSVSNHLLIDDSELHTEKSSELLSPEDSLHFPATKNLRTIQEGEGYQSLEQVGDRSLECNKESSVLSVLVSSPQCEPITHTSDQTNNILCIQNHMCDKDSELDTISTQLESSNVLPSLDTNENQENNAQSCDRNSHPSDDLTRENPVSQCESSFNSVYFSIDSVSSVLQNDQNRSISNTISKASKSLPSGAFHNVDTPLVESLQYEKCSGKNQAVEAVILSENFTIPDTTYNNYSLSTNIDRPVENSITTVKETAEPVAKKVNIYLPNDSNSNFLTKDIVTQYTSQIYLESETDETSNRLICLDRRQVGQLKRKLKMIRHAKYNSETFREKTSNLNSIENENSSSEADSPINQLSDNEQLISSKCPSRISESYDEVSGGVISETASFDGFHKSKNQHFISCSSNENSIKSNLLSDLSSNLKNLAPWLEEKVLNHQAPGPVTAAILGQSVVQLPSHVSIDLTVDE